MKNGKKLLIVKRNCIGCDIEMKQNDGAQFVDLCSKCYNCHCERCLIRGKTEDETKQCVVCERNLLLSKQCYCAIHVLKTNDCVCIDCLPFFETNCVNTTNKTIFS